MARKEKKPKREFRPQAHATVYLIALLYVGYLLVSMILRALRGGPEAPTGLQLALGILILGGGAAVLGVLTWHMLHLPPAGPKPEEPAPADTPQGDGLSEPGVPLQDVPAAPPAQGTDSLPQPRDETER